MELGEICSRTKRSSKEIGPLVLCLIPRETSVLVLTIVDFDELIEHGMAHLTMYGKRVQTNIQFLRLSLSTVSQWRRVILRYLCLVVLAYNRFD